MNSSDSKNSPRSENGQRILQKIPRHVAIIMDGNGRWAEAQGLMRFEGHRRGVETVRTITEECNRLGIEQLTLFCLSSENWKRPQEELDFLMTLLSEYLLSERPTLVKNGLRFSVIGDRQRLPADIQQLIHENEALCRDHRGTRLCLAINYGSRGEIVDAARRLAQEVASGDLLIDEIDEQVFADRLYTAGMPDPDLLIRTSGEMRISNYLLWQISYSELFVVDKKWPEFTEEDLHAAIEEYSKRERRFGGLLERREA
ncbi:MAG: isoprenyl transferase [Pirellulaceae bacterium]|nr:isoprenyl transferase [Pirellulaceae bacterium]